MNIFNFNEMLSASDKFFKSSLPEILLLILAFPVSMFFLYYLNCFEMAAFVALLALQPIAHSLAWEHNNHIPNLVVMLTCLAILVFSK